MVTVGQGQQGRRRETRALLRAHLSAAARYGHWTRNCVICHRLQRLALEQQPESPEVLFVPALTPDQGGPAPDVAVETVSVVADTPASTASGDGPAPARSAATSASTAAAVDPGAGQPSAPR